MTTLDRLWPVASFRDTLNRLAAAEPARLAEYFAYLTDDLDPAAEPFDDDESKMISVAGSLLRAAEDDGLEEVSEFLTRRLRSGQSLVSALSEGFVDTYETPTGIVRRFQLSVAPAVERSALTLDLRVVRDPDDRIRLVPVGILRMGIDEAIGGMEAIVVQIPDEQLDELEAAISRYRSTREEALAALPESLWAHNFEGLADG